VDNRGAPTEHYPYNPNGSPLGITGLTTTDGRVTIMMPHPERVFRTVQNSWHPLEWGEDGPWLYMFRTARQWVVSDKVAAKRRSSVRDKVSGGSNYQMPEIH